MFTKILVSCALLVAAQAGYIPSNYGGRSAVIGGYAAQIQPAVTLSLLPSYGHGHGHGYGSAPAQGYAIAPSYGVSRGYGAQGSGPISIPVYSSGPAISQNAGVDAEALQLASLALSLPSAGAPSSAIINIPQYSTTSYSAPAVVAGPSSTYGGSVNGASAAAAAANVAAANVGAANVGAANVGATNVGAANIGSQASYNSIY